MSADPATTPETQPAAAPPLSQGDFNNNPPKIAFHQLLLEDYRNHDSRWTELGLWAVLVHRFGNWRMGFRSKIARAPLTLIYRFLYLMVEITTGISLPYTVQVGRRVRIWHQGGIILHARSIGDDTQIRQNTTMGIVAADRLNEIPTIGARVDIGCGACLLGHVHIGDDAKIGANAVVIHDVPAGATAVGVPARIVRRVARDES